MVGEHVGFELLHLLLVEFVELFLDEFSLAFEHSDTCLVTRLHHYLVQVNGLLLDFNLLKFDWLRLPIRNVDINCRQNLLLVDLDDALKLHEHFLVLIANLLESLFEVLLVQC